MMWGTDYPPGRNLAEHGARHSQHLPRCPRGGDAEDPRTERAAVFNFDAAKILDIAQRISPKPAEVARRVPVSELPDHPGFTFHECGQYS